MTAHEGLPGAAGDPAGAAGEPAGSLTGRQLGRYLIGPLLGSGGVAVVYRAHDQVAGLDVALKILPPSADRDALVRFRREALTAGGLRHPNIVRTLQVGTPGPGEIAYIAMELVEGQTLGDLLTARGRLRPDESARLLHPIADALAAAHAAGVVHRDVKPANILLKPVPAAASGAVRVEGLHSPVIPMLADFGVALALDSPDLTGQGHTVGTPAYMAPEQCAGSRQIDGRADLYALGVILYRCVVGQLPFAGTTTQILYAHVYEPLRIPDAILRQLPPIVVDVLRQSMAKAPEERYPAAAAMAHDLAQIAGVSDPRLPTGSSAVSPADATGTATMALPVPSRQPPTPPSTGSIIVPAPQPETDRPSADRGTNTRSAARATARRRVNWLGILALIAALALGLALASLVVRLGVWPPGADAPPPQGPTILAPAVAPASATPSPTVPDAAGAQEGPAAAIAATATATVQPAPATPTPSPTEASPAPPTAAPAASPTETPTEVALEAPTEAPTPLPESTPTPTLAPQISSCASLVDPFFGDYLSGLESSMAQSFTCPTGDGNDATGLLLRFEYGFMLQLDNDPAILIYYDLNQEWERVVSDWLPGDPPLKGDFPPPNADLYQPEGAFGRLWAEPQRQAALGFATATQPRAFPAVSQSFPGGTLVGDRDTNAIYLFLRDKLRL